MQEQNKSKAVRYIITGILIASPNRTAIAKVIKKYPWIEAALDDVHKSFLQAVVHADRDALLDGLKAIGLDLESSPSATSAILKSVVMDGYRAEAKRRSKCIEYQAMADAAPEVIKERTDHLNDLLNELTETLESIQWSEQDFHSESATMKKTSSPELQTNTAAT